MARKTGSKTFKTRMLMKAARLWKQKQLMREEGIGLGSKKPKPEIAKEKEAELEELYLELTGPKEKSQEA